MKIRLASFTIVVATAAATPPAIAQDVPAGTAQELSVSVWARPGDVKERLTLVRTLSEVAELEKRSVPAGTDIGDLLRKRCGGARPEVLTVFRELNPGLTLKGLLTTADTQVTLPACPFWTEQASSIAVPAGSAVRDQVFLALGTSGKDTMDKVQALNPGRALDKVAAGTAIKVPYTTRPVTYTLKSDIKNAADPRAERDRIEAAVRSISGVIAAGTGQLRSIQPVLASAATTGSCEAIAATPNWPFNASRLSEILKHNAAERTTTRAPAIAAVADSGIEFKESRLPLSNSDRESDDPTKDGDENKYNGDRIGVNIPKSRGFPLVDLRDPDAKHGTHVAGLVSGQTMTATLADAAKKRVNLKILNLKDHNSIPNPTGGDPLTSFFIQLGALADAITYSEVVRANVVNLSVESEDRLPTFEARLPETAVLSVVAAGNSTFDLDKQTPAIFPAVYRLEFPGKLITVAAHDPEGKLASFSNFGKKTVDLAAPGVCVQSFVPGGKTEALSGTSQAAPLVSFTAALLAYEGLPAQTIKSRIVHTVDIDRDLPVASEGKLNILKAVACYDDQIEVEKRGWLRGRFDADATIDIDGESTPLSDLLRVMPRYAKDSDKPMRVWKKKIVGPAEPAFAARPPGATIAFEVLGGSSPEHFPLEQVIDIIPQICKPRQP